jgi:hypothetical protein
MKKCDVQKLLSSVVGKVNFNRGICQVVSPMVCDCRTEGNLCRAIVIWHDR